MSSPQDGGPGGSSASGNNPNQINEQQTTGGASSSSQQHLRMRSKESGGPQTRNSSNESSGQESTAPFIINTMESFLDRTEDFTVNESENEPEARPEAARWVRENIRPSRQALGRYDESQHADSPYGGPRAREWMSPKSKRGTTSLPEYDTLHITVHRAVDVKADGISLDLSEQELQVQLAFGQNYKLMSPPKRFGIVDMSATINLFQRSKRDDDLRSEVLDHIVYEALDLRDALPNGENKGVTRQEMAHVRAFSSFDRDADRESDFNKSDAMGYLVIKLTCPEYNAFTPYMEIGSCVIPGIFVSDNPDFHGTYPLMCPCGQIGEAGSLVISWKASTFREDKLLKHVKGPAKKCKSTEREALLIDNYIDEKLKTTNVPQMLRKIGPSMEELTNLVVYTVKKAIKQIRVEIMSVHFVAQVDKRGILERLLQTQNHAFDARRVNSSRPFVAIELGGGQYFRTPIATMSSQIGGDAAYDEWISGGLNITRFYNTHAQHRITGNAIAKQAMRVLKLRKRTRKIDDAGNVGALAGWTVPAPTSSETSGFYAKLEYKKILSPAGNELFLYFRQCKSSFWYDKEESFELKLMHQSFGGFGADEEMGRSIVNLDTTIAKLYVDELFNTLDLPPEFDSLPPADQYRMRMYFFSIRAAAFMGSPKTAFGIEAPMVDSEGNPCGMAMINLTMLSSGFAFPEKNAYHRNGHPATSDGYNAETGKVLRDVWKEVRDESKLNEKDEKTGVTNTSLASRVAKVERDGVMIERQPVTMQGVINKSCLRLRTDLEENRVGDGTSDEEDDQGLSMAEKRSNIFTAQVEYPPRVVPRKKPFYLLLHNVDFYRNLDLKTEKEAYRKFHVKLGTNVDPGGTSESKKINEGTVKAKTHRMKRTATERGIMGRQNRETDFPNHSSFTEGHHIKKERSEWDFLLGHQNLLLPVSVRNALCKVLLAALYEHNYKIYGNEDDASPEVSLATAKIAIYICAILKPSKELLRHQFCNFSGPRAKKEYIRKWESLVKIYENADMDTRLLYLHRLDYFDIFGNPKAENDKQESEKSELSPSHDGSAGQASGRLGEGLRVSMVPNALGVSAAPGATQTAGISSVGILRKDTSKKEVTLDVDNISDQSDGNAPIKSSRRVNSMRKSVGFGKMTASSRGRQSSQSLSLKSAVMGRSEGSDYRRPEGFALNSMTQRKTRNIALGDSWRTTEMTADEEELMRCDGGYLFGRMHFAYTEEEKDEYYLENIPVHVLKKLFVIPGACMLSYNLKTAASEYKIAVARACAVYNLELEDKTFGPSGSFKKERHKMDPLFVTLRHLFILIKVFQGEKVAPQQADGDGGMGSNQNLASVAHPGVLMTAAQRDKKNSAVSWDARCRQLLLDFSVSVFNDPKTLAVFTGDSALPVGTIIKLREEDEQQVRDSQNTIGSDLDRIQCRAGTGLFYKMETFVSRISTYQERRDPDFQEDALEGTRRVLQYPHNVGIVKDTEVLNMVQYNAMHEKTLFWEVVYGRVLGPKQRGEVYYPVDWFHFLWRATAFSLFGGAFMAVSIPLLWGNFRLARRLSCRVWWPMWGGEGPRALKVVTSPIFVILRMVCWLTHSVLKWKPRLRNRQFEYPLILLATAYFFTQFRQAVEKRDGQVREMALDMVKVFRPAPVLSKSLKISTVTGFSSHRWICIPGYLIGTRFDVYEPFSSLKSEVCCLRYETARLLQLAHKHVGPVGLFGHAQKLYQASIVFRGYFGPPSLVTWSIETYLGSLSSPEEQIRARAPIIGRTLANHIYRLDKPVSLCAFSLGNDVLIHCLMELLYLYRTRRHKNLVQNVIMLGAGLKYSEISSYFRKDILKHQNERIAARDFLFHTDRMKEKQVYHNAHDKPGPFTDEASDQGSDQNSEGDPNAPLHGLKNDTEKFGFAFSGGPVDIEREMAHLADEELWFILRQEVVHGKFINVYAQDDIFLQSMWELYAPSIVKNVKSDVIGVSGLYDVPGIDNVDVTNVLRGHFDYHTVTKKVLASLGV